MTGALVQSRNTIDEDLAFWGIDPKAVSLPEEAGIWAEHLTALNAFLAMAGQWRTIFNGEKVIWIGLDYAAAKPALDLAGLTLTPAEWADVQVIEAGARAALNGN